MFAYYNEIDPAAAVAIRALIEDGQVAPGDVDERKEDVTPECPLPLFFLELYDAHGRRF